MKTLIVAIASLTTLLITTNGYSQCVNGQCYPASNGVFQTQPNYGFQQGGVPSYRIQRAYVATPGTTRIIYRPLPTLLPNNVRYRREQVFIPSQQVAPQYRMLPRTPARSSPFLPGNNRLGTPVPYRMNCVNGNCRIQ